MARNADGLGLFGAWLNPRYPDEQRIKFAAELEDLGFRTIWLGGGLPGLVKGPYARRQLRATRAESVASDRFSSRCCSPRRSWPSCA